MGFGSKFGRWRDLRKDGGRTNGLDAQVGPIEF